MDLKKISVTILTRNSEKHLAECLDSVKDFGEVILLDNGSEDKTFEIAAKYNNVKVFKDKFNGFGPLKNKAADLASNSWIFNVDSDEILTEEIINEIKETEFKKNHVFNMKRFNYYGNKFIKCCGWYPDRVIRIYNKKITRYHDYQVHESVKLKGVKLIPLKNGIKHYSVERVEELIDKMQRYSSLFADDYKGRKKSSGMKAFGRGLFSFVKNYFFRKGIFYGYEGFLLAFWIASGAYFKYIKLYERNKNK
ncbi:MAG: glycosyltransferase family 2 protein [Candidatus Muiribacteriota bacterium]